MYIFEEMLDKTRAPTPDEIAAAAVADTSKPEFPAGTPAEKRKEAVDLMAEIRVRDGKRDQDFASWLLHSVTLKGI